MTPNHTAQSVEEVVEEFDKTFGHNESLGCDTEETFRVWSSDQDGKEIPQWLRTTLTTRDEAVRAERDAEYKPIIDWLLGQNGDFPNLAEKPHYRFRTELRERLSKLTPPTQ